MNSIDPILLQRLIDGELELNQVQQLVKEADLSSVQWREIAVAMIEDRIWQSTFSASRDNVDSIVNAARPTIPSPEREPVAPIKPSNERGTSKSGSADSGTFDGDRWQSSSFRYLLAASLLLAVGIGYLIHGMLDSSSLNRGQSIAIPNDPIPLDPGSAIASNSPSIGSNPGSMITQTSYRPQYHVEMPSERLLPDQNIGPVDPVPLYSVRNSSDFRAFQQRQAKTAIDPELVKRLSESGFRMQEDIEFISGNVNDDESFIIPIRTIRIVPRQ